MGDLKTVSFDKNVGLYVRTVIPKTNLMFSLHTICFN